MIQQLTQRSQLFCSIVVLALSIATTNYLAKFTEAGYDPPVSPVQFRFAIFVGACGVVDAFIGTVAEYVPAIPWIAVLVVDGLAGMFFLSGGVVSCSQSLSMDAVGVAYSLRRNLSRWMKCGSMAVVVRIIGMRTRRSVFVRRPSRTIRSCSSVSSLWLWSWDLDSFDVGRRPSRFLAGCRVAHKGHLIVFQQFQGMHERWLQLACLGSDIL